MTIYTNYDLEVQAIKQQPNAVRLNHAELRTSDLSEILRNTVKDQEYVILNYAEAKTSDIAYLLEEGTA